MDPGINGTAGGPPSRRSDGVAAVVSRPPPILAPQRQVRRDAPAPRPVNNFRMPASGGRLEHPKHDSDGQGEEEGAKARMSFHVRGDTVHIQPVLPLITVAYTMVQYYGVNRSVTVSIDIITNSCPLIGHGVGQCKRQRRKAPEPTDAFDQGDCVAPIRMLFISLGCGG